MERAKALNGAREELLKQYAKRKLAFGLRHTCSPKSKEQEEDLRNLPYGSSVLVFRDKPKTWEGPFPFVSIDGNTVVVQLPHRRKIFRLTAVKPGPLPSSSDSNEKYDDLSTDVSYSRYFMDNYPCESTEERSHQLSNEHAERPNTVPDFTESRGQELQNLLKRDVLEIVERYSIQKDQEYMVVDLLILSKRTAMGRNIIGHDLSHRFSEMKAHWIS